ncbi:hypothetical protein DL95DRAFT_462049 [Leptodontidium sp. 2 PMI_412]|nr:hypothetical protein DL95DRAFT_462049 [Leptodontidium sp. 2 PMI_412]
MDKTARLIVLSLILVALDVGFGLGVEWKKPGGIRFRYAPFLLSIATFGMGIIGDVVFAVLRARRSASCKGLRFGFKAAAFALSSLTFVMSATDYDDSRRGIGGDSLNSLTHVSLVASVVGLVFEGWYAGVHWREWDDPIDNSAPQPASTRGSSGIGDIRNGRGRGRGRGGVIQRRT